MKKRSLHQRKRLWFSPLKTTVTTADQQATSRPLSLSHSSLHLLKMFDQKKDPNFHLNLATAGKQNVPGKEITKKKKKCTTLWTIKVCVCMKLLSLFFSWFFFSPLWASTWSVSLSSRKRKKRVFQGGWVWYSSSSHMLDVLIYGLKLLRRKICTWLLWS